MSSALSNNNNTKNDSIIADTDAIQPVAASRTNNNIATSSAATAAAPSLQETKNLPQSANSSSSKKDFGNVNGNNDPSQKSNNAMTPSSSIITTDTTKSPVTKEQQEKQEKKTPRKRNQPTDGFRYALCKEYEQSQIKGYQKFINYKGLEGKVDRSNLSRWHKSYQKGELVENGTMSKKKKVTYPKTEDAFLEYLNTYIDTKKTSTTESQAQQQLPSTKIMLKVAFEKNREFHPQESGFQASNGWLWRFLRRHNFKKDNNNQTKTVSTSNNNNNHCNINSSTSPSTTTKKATIQELNEQVEEEREVAQLIVDLEKNQSNNTDNSGEEDVAELNEMMNKVKQFATTHNLSEKILIDIEELKIKIAIEISNIDGNSSKNNNDNNKVTSTTNVTNTDNNGRGDENDSKRNDDDKEHKDVSVIYI